MSNFGEASFPSEGSPVKTGGSGNFADCLRAVEADKAGVVSQIY